METVVDHCVLQVWAEGGLKTEASRRGPGGKGAMWCRWGHPPEAGKAGKWALPRGLWREGGPAQP